jgi:hypothetical protein
MCRGCRDLNKLISPRRTESGEGSALWSCFSYPEKETKPYFNELLILVN